MFPSAQPAWRLSRPFRFGFLAVALPLSFLSFQFFPGMPLVHEAWFVLMALALLLVYLPWRFRKRGRPRGFEIYVLLLAVAIPIWSALAAQREFGQPFFYGLLAQRGMVLAAAVPLLTWMGLDRGWVRIRDLEDVLLLLAWGTFGLYLVMTVFLTPGDYFAMYGLGFVSSADSNAQFKFDVVFIIFGFYYYGFRGLRTHAWKDHFRAAAFLLFLLLVIHGRSLLLFLLGVYLLLVVVWTPNKTRLIALLPKIGLSLVLLWVILGFTAPDFTHTLTIKFKDAFTVILTGEMTDDASANSRIQQALVATPYTIKNWLFGNGIISAQWGGGFETVIGDYFHPPDIGILGILFLYGVAGTLFYAGQFMFASAFSRRAASSSGPRQDLVRALKGLIIFSGFRSLATAQFAYFPEPILFAATLLWAIGTSDQAGVPAP